MVGFVKTILIILLFYYAFRFFGRYVFPVLLKNYVSKKFGQQQSGSTNKNRNYRKEGEVNIDYIPQKGKKVSKDKGDYVDYEEVKD